MFVEKLKNPKYYYCTHCVNAFDRNIRPWTLLTYMYIHSLSTYLSKISPLKFWPYFSDKDSATFFGLCSCLFRFYVADYDSLIF